MSRSGFFSALMLVSALALSCAGFRPAVAQMQYYSVPDSPKPAASRPAPPGAGAEDDSGDDEASGDESDSASESGDGDDGDDGAAAADDAGDDEGAVSGDAADSGDDEGPDYTTGSFVVTPVDDCFKQLTPDEAAELRRDHPHPWQACRALLDKREKEKAALAAKKKGKKAKKAKKPRKSAPDDADSRAPSGDEKPEQGFNR